MCKCFSDLNTKYIIVYRHSEILLYSVYKFSENEAVNNINNNNGQRKKRQRNQLPEKGNYSPKC